ncbi:MAG: hypothetical protein WC942_11030 [Clostridia bacterium]|jgi:hypothetical protein
MIIKKLINKDNSEHIALLSITGYYITDSGDLLTLEELKKEYNVYDISEEEIKKKFKDSIDNMLFYYGVKIFRK